MMRTVEKEGVKLVLVWDWSEADIVSPDTVQPVAEDEIEVEVLEAEEERPFLPVLRRKGRQIVEVISLCSRGLR
jgi:hypothetical protein